MDQINAVTAIVGAIGLLLTALGANAVARGSSKPDTATLMMDALKDNTENMREVKGLMFKIAAVLHEMNGHSKDGTEVMRDVREALRLMAALDQKGR
jgi:uncharacterized protein YktB (UPF0637 family)